MAESYYDLLGVRPDAGDDELKRAYRRLARELHPDANGGDATSEARFKEVTVAYETLRDPERRRRYDLFGPDGARQGGGPAGGDPFAGGLGDLFDAFFGGGASPFGGGAPRRTGPRRGEDAEAILDLRFDEAVFGVERTLDLRQPAPCEECGGSGAAPGTTATSCADCAGSGQVRRVRQSILGQVVTTTPCPACRGLGEVVTSPCTRCRGDGRRIEERSVRVDVPAGVDDGTTLRINGAGAAALRGGIPGDLYVHLRVAPDARFERSGADLVTDLHVAMTQAALGAEVDLELLDGGTETISVPAGTPSGKVVRVRNQGVPHVRGRGRGDLIVRVVVDIPERLSKEEEQLLRQLADLRGEAVASGDHGGGLFHRLRSSLG
ncbi:MAG: J domain-containing protein [Actinomycetota bacterium]|nr:J domain-containing protein [Actinomycetota bacterium]